MEAEVETYLTTALRLHGSLGYLDAHYTRYTNCAVPVAVGGGVADCSGHRIIGAPSFTFQAAAAYTYPIPIGALQGRSGVFGRPDAGL